MDSSGSDYEVEDYVKPDRVIKSVNGEQADLMGNFDDEKRAEIFSGKCNDEGEGEINETYSDAESNATEIYKDARMEQLSNSNEAEKQQNKEKEEKGQVKEKQAGSSACNYHMHNESNNAEQKTGTILTKEQLMRLRRGTRKANRYVLYVTNLNFDTTAGMLKDLFNTVGKVRSIRLPKRRRGGFAFVEMDGLDSYQRAFDLHNAELMGRSIKIQYSEAGNRRSANKKNVLKQKNRKLAEMRSEYKLFTKSGKFYDKALKKEKSQKTFTRNRLA